MPRHVRSGTDRRKRLGEVVDGRARRLDRCRIARSTAEPIRRGRLAVVDLDPLAPLLARNVEHRQKLLQLAGGALSAEEAGRTLGITRQAVDKRRRANTLLAVREGSDWRYPACQFHQGEILPGIAYVVRGFATVGPWAALDFLLASDTVLEGDTPLQVLQRGDRDRVLGLVHSSQGDGFS